MGMAFFQVLCTYESSKFFSEEMKTHRQGRSGRKIISNAGKNQQEALPHFF
jgi:hypothetical protein